MPMDQTKAPIVDALQAYKTQGTTSFGVPGHKSGVGATEDVKRLLGPDIFAADSTTEKGIDDRRETKRVVQQAEELAAEAWGAAQAHLSTNGTSLSNHVAFLCMARPGDTVLVARNSHLSVIAGLVLAGLRPVFLDPDHDAGWDIDHGIPAAELERKLAAHPEAKGVLIVSPTYYGVTSDIAALAAVCHRHGVPLAVDEAWGPHFAFHPEMPPAAIRSGADLAVGSIHKTMAGLQGASILLLNSKLVTPDRFALSYALFESTSPPVPVLATIDATRRQFALEGERLIGGQLHQAHRARQAIAGIEGIRVMGREVLDGDARHALDETKLFFDISGLGVSGYAADDWLTGQRNLSMGLSDERHLLATWTVGNTEQHTDTLIAGIHALADWARQAPARRPKAPAGLPRRDDLRTEMVMTPAEAFFGRTEFVPLERAAGRVVAEIVAPYPPGIPRLVPGELITETHVAYFRLGLEAGLFPMGQSDLELHTLRVVA